MFNPPKSPLIRITTLLFGVFALLLMLQYLLGAAVLEEGESTTAYFQHMLPFIVPLLVQVAGAVLLWKGRKSGFYLFLLGWLLPAVLPFVSEQYEVSLVVLVSGVFVGLYALGLKED